MQLAERKVKILKAVVESYIKNGDPVGSKVLCSLLDFPVSSATVRNEMAELSELGLLTQPHTSAGRIPSENGYRLYVNELMGKKKLPDETKALISASIESAADDPERILRKAAEVVSDILHTAIIATTPSSETARIRRLRFIQTGRQTCMVVLMTSTGLIKNRLVKCDYVVTPELIRAFETIFNRKLAGVPIKSFTPAFVQTFAAELGGLAMLVPSLLSAMMDACGEISCINIAAAGKLSLIFRTEYDYLTLKALTKFLHSDDELAAFAMDIFSKRKILIGSDIGIDVLKDFSVVSSPYSIERLNDGLVAAIIPMRSDYAYAAAVLDYTAECIGRLIRELLMPDG